MTEITLDAMIRRLSRLAEQIFRKEGEVPALWLFDVPGKGQQLVVSPDGISTRIEASRLQDQLADTMRELLEEHGATRYAFACECWTVMADAGGTPGGPLIRWLSIPSVARR